MVVFVCVKQRDDKKASCACRGSRELLGELRAAALKADWSGEGQLEIRPSGCLKKCKKGPAVAAFIEDAGQELRKPPKKAWKKAEGKWKLKNQPLLPAAQLMAELKQLRSKTRE